MTAKTKKGTHPVFSLDKIYTKDISLEIPHAPEVFLKREQPQISLNINYATEQVKDSVYQTVLKATVDAKINEEQLFLIEIEQAGVFQMQNISAEQMELLQNIECPNALFPYLRETVSDLSVRAGFLPVLLAPINFAVLYQQKQQSIAASGMPNATIN